MGSNRPKVLGKGVLISYGEVGIHNMNEIFMDRR